MKNDNNGMLVDAENEDEYSYALNSNRLAITLPEDMNKYIYLMFNVGTKVSIFDRWYSGYDDSNMFILNGTVVTEEVQG